MKQCLQSVNHEQFSIQMTQNNKHNKWLEILDFQPKLLWRTPTKIHREQKKIIACGEGDDNKKQRAKHREHRLAQRRQRRRHSDHKHVQRQRQNCTIRRFRKKPEFAWKRGLRALRPSRRLAVKTNGCRKKCHDGASKYRSCQIDTRGKNGRLKIYRLNVNQVKFW